MPSKKGKPEPTGRVLTYTKASLGSRWVAEPNATDEDFDAFYALYKKIPIVRAAVDIQVDHMMASGYELEPKNEEWDEAVGLSARLRETGYGLIIYGNWLLEITRGPPPYSEAFPGILGVPPQCMLPHGTGNEIEYWTERNNWGSTKKYLPDEDIVHIHTDILDGSKWGPGTMRTLYTVLNMKTAMENMDYNVFGQFAQPMHVFMIPKDGKNVPTRAEMQQFLRDFEDMTEEEIKAMAINKNVEIQIIGSDRNIPDFSFFIDHIDTQCYAGLGVYPVLMERGQNATEATAKIQLAAFNRRTEARQHIIEQFFNRKILNKLSPPCKIKFNPPVEPTFNVPATDAGKGGEQGGRGNDRPQSVPPQRQSWATAR
jgi:hypothetical protein